MSVDNGGLCAGCVWLKLDNWFWAERHIIGMTSSPSGASRRVRLAGVAHHRLLHSRPGRLETPGRRGGATLHDTVVLPAGIGHITLATAITVMKAIDNGKSASVGVSVANGVGEIPSDHVVLAYGYEYDGQNVVLHVHNPNRGGFADGRRQRHPLFSDRQRG